MEKKIDLSRTVFALTNEYPQLKDLLKENGLEKITEPAVLQSIGRTVTLPELCRRQNIDLQVLKQKLTENGYLPFEKKDALKNMISRLNEGEALASVQKDFSEQFSSVSVQEIMDAEQALIDEGVPETEIQSLCDLHSSLFHGKTEAEILAEEQAAESIYLIDLLKAENRQLEKRIAALYRLLNAPEGKVQSIKEQLVDLRALKSHYAKKEELIMPYLYSAGITGPSTVMWGVDDEIFRDLIKLTRTITEENILQYKDAALALLVRMQEMIYKEEAILFVMAADTLKKEDWLETYPDIDEYGLAWLKDYPVWPEGENWKKEHPFVFQDLKIDLPDGKISVEQLERMLKVLPVDITYIDENDDLIFFTNEGKVFARPHSALNRKVYGCHPPRIVPIVENMLADFKAHKKDRVERWLPNAENPVKVVYQAVYDQDGKYKGTVETVQEFGKEKDVLARFVQNAEKN